MAYTEFTGELDDAPKSDARTYTEFTGELDPPAKPAAAVAPAAQAVPEMTAGSVARDIASGALQIGPAAVGGIGAAARLLTGDAVGKGLTDFADRGQQAIREVVGSERAAAQAKLLKQEMQPAEGEGFIDGAMRTGRAIAANPGAAADMILPSIGSMLVPAGAAGALGKGAKALAAARGATAAGQTAAAATGAAIGLKAGTVATNAGDTYGEIIDAGGSQADAYKGAGIAAAATLVADKLASGGAEGELVKRILSKGQSTAATSAAAKAAGVAGAAIKEGGQEVIEGAGQDVGSAVGNGEDINLAEVGGNAVLNATLGAVVGGGLNSVGAIADTAASRAGVTPVVAPGGSQAAPAAPGGITPIVVPAAPAAQQAPAVEPVAAPAQEAARERTLAALEGLAASRAIPAVAPVGQPTAPNAPPVDAPPIPAQQPAAVEAAPTVAEPVTPPQALPDQPIDPADEAFLEDRPMSWLPSARAQNSTGRERTQQLPPKPAQEAAVDPDMVWMGRKGTGYETAGDAKTAGAVMENRRPDLDWTVEQTQDGRFRLAGRARGSVETAQAPLASPAVTTKTETAPRAGLEGFLRHVNVPADISSVAATNLKSTPVPTRMRESIGGDSGPILVSSDGYAFATPERIAAATTADGTVPVVQTDLPGRAMQEQIAAYHAETARAAPQATLKTQIAAKTAPAAGAGNMPAPALNRGRELEDLADIAKTWKSMSGQDVDLVPAGGADAILSKLASVMRAPISFFSDRSKRADFSGVKAKSGRIYINTASKDAPLAIAMHEVVHTMDEDIKADLIETVMATVGKRGRSEFASDYAGYGSLPQDRQDEELVAMLAQDEAKRPEFWRDLRTKMGDTAFGRFAGDVLSALDRLIGALKGAPHAKYSDDLKAVRAALVKAYSAQANRLDEGSAESADATAIAPRTEDRTEDQTGDVAFSMREADFTDPEQRTEVSTTRPRAKGSDANPVTQKWVIDAADIKASEKHVAAVVKAISGYNTLSGNGDASAKLQELHEAVVENLLWLHDLVPAGVRSRAKLWYDGANAIASDWTRKYAISERQAAGVLAVLSPQRDWFQNVSLGERVITVWRDRQNESWSPAMTAWVESWVGAAKTVDEKEARSKVLDAARRLEGAKLYEMNDADAAKFVRVFDETYHDRRYRLVTPEGGFGDYVTNSGDGDSSVTWGGFSTIEKAVSILNDGSFRNVEALLGSEHKVRNFFNNIAAPNSADGHVTIDTHAVAAALVKGLGGNAKEVKDNFGGAGSNAATGAGGTYGLFADAYRDAAAQRGVLAREMQSITWEAVRSLFPAEAKAAMAPKVDAIWDRFRAGEITRDQARKQVKELAGGIRQMAWEGSGAGKRAADGGESFDRVIEADPTKRVARKLDAVETKDTISVSLSAATGSIPGIKRLYDMAGKGDAYAHTLLQDIATDSLRHLLGGTSASITADRATGLYGGSVEPSLSVSVKFADSDRARVLAALAKFAENFGQEQVHVRGGTKHKAGTEYEDGSYSTPVYRWSMKKAMDRKAIQRVIDKSGLYGLTFGDDFVEAYYVGDPTDEQARGQFEDSIAEAGRLLGPASAGIGRETERLWVYGQGDGSIGYERIRGDVAAGPATESDTARRVAEYLNRAGDKPGRVRTFAQAKEVTPEQAAKQRKIAAEYEARPDNDLKNPRVRRAYAELAKEVTRQFDSMPIKVEVFTGDGEPYKSSADMRRDVLDNNHLFIFGTNSNAFGPEGVDFTGHPMLEPAGRKDAKGKPLLMNDLLRAVHDYFAHSMAPIQFGAKGEEAAWLNHMSVTANPWARWALTAETRGQNSWVNFNPAAEGVPVADRPFARQKAILLPIEYSLTGDAKTDAPMRSFIAALPAAQRIGSKPDGGAQFAIDLNSIKRPDPKPPTRARNGRFISRDALGYTGSAQGAAIYRAIAKIAAAVSKKLGLRLEVMPVELRRAQRQMKMEIDRAMEATAKVATEMKDISAEDREMISDIIEGELKAGVTPAKRILDIAASISRLMTQQSDDLVEVGMLDKDAADELRGRYLPRFYDKHLAKDGEAGWLAALKNMRGGRSMMKGINGSSLKRRGMTKTVPASELKSYEDLGWKMDDPKFDPAKHDEVRVHRDFTKDERVQMEENRDSMLRFVLGYTRSQKDLALGRLFEHLADTVGKRTEREGYVQVPDTKIEGTSVPRYGKLAGLYVPEAYMDHLSKFDAGDFDSALKTYRKLLGHWKLGKTAMNPVAHFNNFVSNISMAHFGGVSYWDWHKYAGAIRDMATKNEAFMEAKGAGLFGGSYSEAEIVSDMPKELQVLMKQQATRSERVASKLWTIATLGPVGEYMKKAYGGGDALFKYVLYRDAKQKGLHSNDAVDHAVQYIFEYDSLPIGARVARDAAIPFFSYTYQVVPLLLRTALEHPLRIAAPAAMLYAGSLVSYAMTLGSEDDDDADAWDITMHYLQDRSFRERVSAARADDQKNLPIWQRGLNSLGMHQTMRLGTDETTGKPVFLDIARLMPGTGILDVENNAGGIPLPQAITPGGPLFSLFSGVFVNRDLFTGKDVSDDSDTFLETTGKRTKFAWQTIAPAISPGQAHLDRLMNAAANKANRPIGIPGVAEYTGIDKSGDPAQMKYALMNTVGIKAKPTDLGATERYDAAAKKRLILEIQIKIKSTKRAMANGFISDDAGSAEIERQREKISNLREGLDVDGNSLE